VFGIVFGIEVSLGLEEGGANRTMPWFGERLVDPRRWKDGGMDGTWSRCICWIVWGVNVSFGKTSVGNGEENKEKTEDKKETSMRNKV